MQSLKRIVGMLIKNKDLNKECVHFHDVKNPVSFRNYDTSSARQAVIYIKNKQVYIKDSEKM